MNKKLTFPELAELLSEATNTSKRMSELFLRELFATIAQCLIEGESVKVKNLGVFKVSEVSSRKSVDVNTGRTIEIAGHKKITFTPDKSMAEAVNASFACFEAVVLDDDVTNEMIQEIDDAASNEEPAAELTPSVNDEVQELQDSPQEIDEDASTVEQAEQVVVTPPAFSLEQSQPASEELAAELPVAEEADEDQVNADQESESVTPEGIELSTPKESTPSEDVDEEESDKSEQQEESEDLEEAHIRSHHHHHSHKDTWYNRNRFGIGFMTGVLTGIVFVLACLLYLVSNDYIGLINCEPVVMVEEELVLPADTVPTEELPNSLPAEAQEATETPVQEIAKPAAKPAVVTDTVRPGNFLARMAKRFYGNSHFWVYIYEENKATISNPNNVAQGTIVVIPPAEKYGIDATSPESVEKARRKEGEVLNAHK